MWKSGWGWRGPLSRYISVNLRKCESTSISSEAMMGSCGQRQAFKPFSPNDGVLAFTLFDTFVTLGTVNTSLFLGKLFLHRWYSRPFQDFYFLRSSFNSSSHFS